MIVAYDLRFAADHFPGIGTHAFCLLEALLDLPGDERYVVLWNPELTQTRFDFAPLKKHPRVEWIERPYAPISIPSLWRLGRLLREIKPAVYLSPFYLLPFSPGCPTVLTLHDVWPLRLPGGLKFGPRMVYQFALTRAAQADLIVTSSDFSRREIEELAAVVPGQVRVVHLGVPVMRGRPEPRRPAALPRDPFALVVGVNKPHKNLSTLAQAWARLGEQPSLRLVAAGPHDARHPRLTELAEKFGAHAVTVLGRVDEDELEWLYRHATLVLFPSLYEGFGFPVVEAFTHGVPIIASDIPTFRELGDGVVRFCPPRDVAAWATAIAEVGRDAHERARMQDAGLERAKQFTYERTARGTLEVLHDAVRGALVTP